MSASIDGLAPRVACQRPRTASRSPKSGTGAKMAACHSANGRLPAPRTILAASASGSGPQAGEGEGKALNKAPLYKQLPEYIRSPAEEEEQDL